MLKPGKTVYYRTGGDGPLVESIVQRVHRDGSVTVEARFVLKDDGTPWPGFLGYRYRFDASHLVTP